MYDFFFEGRKYSKQEITDKSFTSIFITLNKEALIFKGHYFVNADRFTMEYGMFYGTKIKECTEVPKEFRKIVTKLYWILK